ncbi:3-isopropylmalate/(R)-2-methylmalate dehydratase large subunit [Defluviimonas denitrificans]|jgi:3-isopropylmalate/(R)-2-methylmalate dehydratase large subunit|uniref:3-isopropylmalate dehydratase n=1 Tax=Albidovulum denitrificans TaxID=404881 RepID=A0A2S8SBR2_9RHOB|nr:3-isopropylmalate dehydratase large subunit [Defluviimonas denitrificans]PQV58199.1 3-isopropylmalate/(R)-2-methylmalate dehydratase large subunit [Defluviimonas denitrificans]
MAQATAPAARTLFGKIWDAHEILRHPSGQSLLYIDRDMIHEGSFHAFADLRRRGLHPRRPKQIFGIADHYVPTLGRSADAAASPAIARMIRTFDENMEWGDVRHFGLESREQGIVHVVAPEQGITLPGLTIVCSDSHTSTQGALGAIAFGIGQSENAHVLATQTLWQMRPKTMRVTVGGVLGQGVTAKDVVLALIAKIGAAGAGGHAIEYAGPVVRAMSIEARLTLCNMSIEAAARLGMVAPDDTTFDYVKGRPYAPEAAEWDRALAGWRQLPTDEGAQFDREVVLDGTAIAPMVTWGTSPEDAVPITGRVPDPAGFASAEKRKAAAKSLDYMDLAPGTALDGLKIDRVFIGSCTNSRIEDLRAAAAVLKGRKATVPAIVVPGSTRVREQAEAEGLARTFREAGFEWRHSGCSMCAAMNGDVAAPGERCASTSNRNFVGRQGPGARTHLLSPAMAAAAAIAGHLTDVRRL